jgi:hypothetical protein
LDFGFWIDDFADRVSLTGESKRIEWPDKTEFWIDLSFKEERRGLLLHKWSDLESFFDFNVNFNPKSKIQNPKFPQKNLQHH